MAPSLIQMKEMVRAELGSPNLGAPSDRQIISKLLQHSQNLVNQASNTGHAWDEYELTINVSPGVADYQLSDARYGKALVVYTRDDGNPAHFVRAIDVFELQDLHHGLVLPNDAGAWTMVGYDDSLHTALRVGYYRRGNVPYLRFYPTPQYTCDYDVLFTTGDWSGSATLADSPLFPEHNHLLVARAAISLLADAEWFDDPAANDRKAENKALTLKNDEQIYTTQFNAWILNTHQAQMNERWMPEI